VSGPFWFVSRILPCRSVTGFIVENVGAAVAAVEDVGSLDRRVVRRRFEQRLTAERIARDHLKVYDKLAKPQPAGVECGPRQLPTIATAPAGRW
jgi:hypothetical protein